MSGANLFHPFVLKLEATRWCEFSLWMLIFIFGVPGNLLIIFVHFPQKLKKSTHVFIAALAVADLTTNVLKFVDAITIASVSTYLDYNRQSVVYFLSVGMLYTTALLTSAIAYDRFDAVCHSRRRVVTVRRSKVTVFLCFLIGFIGIIPEGSLRIYESIYGENEDKFTESVMKFIPVAIYIISLLITTVLYGFIFAFIRKHTRDIADAMNENHPSRPNPAPRCDRHNFTQENREDSGTLSSTITSPPPTINNHTNDALSDHTNRAQPRRIPPQRTSGVQRHTTRMLFIANFAFFLLWFPYVYLKFYALGSLFVDFLKSAHNANLVAALLVLKDIAYLNSVINVVIYSVANRRFREECKVVLTKLRRRCYNMRPNRAVVHVNH